MSGLILDLRIAMLNLVEHRRRTALLGAAIAAVTCALVLLTSVSAGISSSVAETATALSTGHLNIGGYFKVTAGQAAPFVADYPKLSALVQKTMPELDFLVVRGRGVARVVSDQDSLESVIYGVDIAREPKLRSALALVSGSMAELAEPNTIMIFEAHAKKLELRVGDALTLVAQTPRGAANTVDCRVAAIARDVGLLSQWSMFVPSEVVRSLYRLNAETTGVIQLHLKESYLEDITLVAARLRKTLENAGYGVMEVDTRPSWMKFQAVARQDWTGQKLDVTSWREELMLLMWTLSAVQGLSALLIVILTVIVVIGIMNTLWITIRERTREIGSLRAIGMQRSAVVRMFLIEASALGGLGATVGAGLGALLAALINLAHIHVPFSMQLFLMRDTLVLGVQPHALLAAIALISAVTAAAALYPALRAARLEPVDAMAHFG